MDSVNDNHRVATVNRLLNEAATLELDVTTADHILAPIRPVVTRSAPRPNPQKPAEQQKPRLFQRISCAELDSNSYDLEYLVDGILVAKQPCILSGAKKTLKTSLLIDLGISLAMGRYFLGKLKVNRACRVGIMTGRERTRHDSRDRTQNRSGGRLSARRDREFDFQRNLATVW